MKKFCSCSSAGQSGLVSQQCPDCQTYDSDTTDFLRSRPMGAGFPPYFSLSGFHPVCGITAQEFQDGSFIIDASGSYLL